MQIDLPEDVIQRATSFASDGETAADVIRKALDAMEHLDRECRAIQQGIDAHEAGRSRPFEEFAAEFMAEKGIKPPQ